MKMQAGFLVAATLALAAFGPSAASAQSPAASDFKRICLDTSADPVAALAAADAAGWAQDAMRSKDYASLSGGSEGRVFQPGTTNFRIFSAGETVSNYQTRSAARVRIIRKCTLLAVEPFDDVAAQVAQLLPIRVGDQTNEQWSWRYAIVDGKHLSLDHGSVEDAVKAGQAEGGQLLLVLVRINGGIILQFTADDPDAAPKPGGE
jgi:hypothetical protein